jgi:hypothetical protein
VTEDTEFELVMENTKFFEMVTEYTDFFELVTENTDFLVGDENYGIF